MEKESWDIVNKYLANPLCNDTDDNESMIEMTADLYWVENENIWDDYDNSEMT